MRLSITRSAAKQLLKIPYRVRERIEKEIEGLTKNPYPSKSQKLSGRDGYRLRVGDYRALYSFDKKAKIITVLSVQHRKDAYKK